MDFIQVNQLIYIYNNEEITSRGKIGQFPPKKGKVELPLFCGNGKRAITIYGGIETWKGLVSYQKLPGAKMFFLWFIHHL